MITEAMINAPEKPKAGRPKILSERAIKRILEAYFGRPLNLETVSLFARDRLRLGLSFLMIRRYCYASVKEMAHQYHKSEPAAFELIRYAVEAGQDHIRALTEIIENHA